MIKIQKNYIKKFPRWWLQPLQKLINPINFIILYKTLNFKAFYDRIQIDKLGSLSFALTITIRFWNRNKDHQTISINIYPIREHIRQLVSYRLYDQLYLLCLTTLLSSCFGTILYLFIELLTPVYVFSNLNFWSLQRVHNWL